MLAIRIGHRVKNILATVQSIVSQTQSAANDPGSAKRDIEARLAALSKANNLLSAGQWARTEPGKLTSQELSHHSGERLAAGGDPVVLTPRMAISVAMINLELSTNAAKYGALSVAGGKVRLDWAVDAAAGAPRMTWRESGGPPVRRPTRKGFGSRMIEKVVLGELGGRVVFDHDPSCRFEIPQRSDMLVAEPS